MVLKKDLMSFCLWLGDTLKLTEFLVVYALLEGVLSPLSAQSAVIFSNASMFRQRQEVMATVPRRLKLMAKS